MAASVSTLMTRLREDLAALLGFLQASTYARRQHEEGICDFVLGNPHDMPLPAVPEAIARWAQPRSPDWFAYTLHEPRAREAVARSLRASHNAAFDAADVFLTPGTFGALSVCLRAVAEAGDEVIFLSPPWFFYEPMIRVAGAEPVRVRLPGPDFGLDVEAIAAAVTERTRAIIVNSPNNPTGRVYRRDELDALAAMLADASQRHGRPIVILSDESYRRVVFDGREFISPAVAYPDTLVMYTYGKVLLAPGERLGYAAVSPEAHDRDALRDALLLSQIVGGWQVPNTVLQRALPDLEDVSIDVGALERRRDRMIPALAEMGYEVVSPDSTFYALVRSPIEDDVAFTEMLAEHDVFVGPGLIFEVPGYFRISLTATDDMVERALPVFREVLEKARA